MKNSKIKSAIPSWKRRIWFQVFLLITISLAAGFSFRSTKMQKVMSRKNDQKIKITLGVRELSASLRESKTTRDFIGMLPLTLTLEDYAGTEKVSDLPGRLSTEDAPSGSDPSIGDITYYAPWGNLAIFYRDFEYASGLIILGHIEGNIEFLADPGPLKVKIELIDK